MHLAFSNLEGASPKSSSGFKVESLWLNGQKRDGKLTGSVEVLQNMISLTEFCLPSNAVNDPLPGWLKDLEGPVPDFGVGIVVVFGICICLFLYVSAWGGYVFIINLVPLYVLVLLTGSYSLRLYVAYNYMYVLGMLLAMQISYAGCCSLGLVSAPACTLERLDRGFAFEIGRNIIHGSDVVESANKEIALRFPKGVADWQSSLLKLPYFDILNFIKSVLVWMTSL
ncbi:hypothetical protein KIW84_051862 [Lathyrus oleraceus]|uniref:dolichyl-diphosphooligosaccharide--protein glycotransferase n=1 Tax=Pisum sativum TaxID=3888 RepID=A0A9D4WNH0_PEA|nr:hypothetical protein KIW84_051862 [Pisum sativum]